MRIVILYGTVGCHLCEEARALLTPLLTAGNWQLQEVDIADDIADNSDLMVKYGARIPVLAIPATGNELDWPFTIEDIARRLSVLS